MEFETKKALLEYLGKNPNDNKLVDRMILRGDVVVRDWMFILVDKDSIIEELKERIKELEKSDTKFISKAMWEKVLAHGEIKRLEEELYEAKTNSDYREARCKRYNDYLQQVIKITYDRIKPKLWNKLEEFDDFREHILSEVKEIKWDED